MADPLRITTASEVKTREKDDIQRLNAQLNLYVQKVRQLGDKGANSATFLATLRSVEEEVSKLKALYETELGNLRRTLDEANKSKNDNSAELDRFQRAARDFGDRYQVEADKNGRLISDITQLQRHVTELEHELANARDAFAIPQRNLAETRAELDRVRIQKVEIAQELEQERANSQQLKDKVDGLHQELDFKDQVHAEQLRDTNSHVEQSKTVIGELESRARQLEYQNASLPSLLDQMRKKTEEEVRLYKDEMNDAANRNITELRSQIAAHISTMEQLRHANAKLQADFDALEGKLRAAEVRAREMQAQKCFLEEQLKLEKARGLEHTRALEQKLRDLNQTLVNKMAEINMNKDAQVYLRAEIEAMRLTLEEEENRLGSLRNQASQSYISSKPVSYDDVRVGYAQKAESAGSRSENSTWQTSTDHGNLARSQEVPNTVSSTKQSGVAANAAGGANAFGVSFKTSGSGALHGKQAETEYQSSFMRGTSAPGRQVHFYRVDGRSGGQTWTGQQPHSVVYRQTRSRSCYDGFPKIATDSMSKGGYTTGCTRMYTNKSRDIRGDGRVANSGVSAKLGPVLRKIVRLNVS